MKTGKKRPAKKQITDAFVDLLENYRLEDISVSQIISCAGISRSTFYRHFNDVPDIFEYLLGAYAQRWTDTFFDIITSLDTVILKMLSESIDYPTIMTLFGFEKSDKIIVDYLCRENNYRAFHLINERCIGVIKEKLKNYEYDSNFLDYACEFVINGVLFSAVADFINNEKIHSSITDFLLCFTPENMVDGKRVKL